MKRTSLFAVAVLFVLVMGCAVPAQPMPTEQPAQPAEATSVPAQSLVWAVKTEARGLDPHVYDFDYDAKPQRAAYEPLVDYEATADGGARLIGVLAESWEASPDAKVWTFHLQPDVTFTDGTPWNAEAAKFNFERLFAIGQVPATRIPESAWPEDMEVVDDLTLRMTLKNGFAPFIDTLVKKFMVSPTAAQEHEVDGDWGQAWLNENMVGTGPYMLDEWVKGQSISLVRNPDYWQGWEGNHVDRIILRYVPEAATQRLLLEQGDVVMAEKIAIEDLDAVAQVPGVVVEEYKKPSLIHLFMVERGPLADVRVREAIAKAFDYDAFVDGVFQGRAVKPRSPLPSAVWAWVPQPEVEYDLDAARQLLADAGYADGFSVKIFTISSFGWFQPQEAQILQAGLKELGIDATIQDHPDAGAYISAVQDPEQGPVIFAWTFQNSYNDPEDNFRRNYRSDGSINFIQYSNERVDELIDQGALLVDRDERQAIYDEIQEILWNDYVAVFTAEDLHYITRRESLHGFEFHPFLVNMGPNWYNMWVE
jgi:peptide/nickel transport system substrate-binding protein